MPDTLKKVNPNDAKYMPQVIDIFSNIYVNGKTKSGKPFGAKELNMVIKLASSIFGEDITLPINIMIVEKINKEIVKEIDKWKQIKN